MVGPGYALGARIRAERPAGGVLGGWLNGVGQGAYVVVVDYGGRDSISNRLALSVRIRILIIPT